jgi:hypothetical protein
MENDFLKKLVIRNATENEFLTIIMPWTRLEGWNHSDCDVTLQYNIDPEGYYLAFLDG